MSSWLLDSAWAALAIVGIWRLSQQMGVHVLSIVHTISKWSLKLFKKCSNVLVYCHNQVSQIIYDCICCILLQDNLHHHKYKSKFVLCTMLGSPHCH